MSTSSTAEALSDREIVATRVFDAPREQMFRAWTEPGQLMRWWGPAGFTNTFHDFDPRPGGVWRLTMHGPDGTDYPNESVFVELVRLERIVLKHLPPHSFQLTATFEDEAGKTKLTWRMLEDSKAHCDKVRLFITQANEQNLDRLEAHLAKMPPKVA